MALLTGDLNCGSCSLDLFSTALGTLRQEICFLMLPVLLNSVWLRIVNLGGV